MEQSSNSHPLIGLESFLIFPMITSPFLTVCPMLTTPLLLSLL